MFPRTPQDFRFTIAVLIIAAGILLAHPALHSASAHDEDTTVVATVGTRQITRNELNTLVRGSLIELKTQRYEILKEGLDSMIEGILIEQAATSRALSVAELMKAEIVDKVTQQEVAEPIGDAEVNAFYEQVKDQVDNRPLDELRPQIEQHLRSQRVAAARAEFLSNLRKNGKVTVALRPLTVEVSAEGPARGPANAPVTIVEFSDFECGFCKRVNQTIEKVMKDYDGKVRLVFRHYPLPFHDNAKPAAEAAICADEGGKFWPYHDLLFQNQQALGKEDLIRYAQQIELDAAAFKKCVDEGNATKIVDKDTADGEAVGVNGTPAFFINGRPLSGAQPYEAFKEVIDDALARSS